MESKTGAMFEPKTYSLLTYPSTNLAMQIVIKVCTVKQY